MCATVWAWAQPSWPVSAVLLLDGIFVVGEPWGICPESESWWAHVASLQRDTGLFPHKQLCQTGYCTMQACGKVLMLHVITGAFFSPHGSSCDFSQTGEGTWVSRTDHVVFTSYIRPCLFQWMLLSQHTNIHTGNVRGTAKSGFGKKTTELGMFTFTHV